MTADGRVREAARREVFKLIRDVCNRYGYDIPDHQRVRIAQLIAESGVVVLAGDVAERVREAQERAWDEGFAAASRRVAAILRRLAPHGDAER